MEKKPKYQLLLIILMPVLLALVMTIINYLFKTNFFVEKFISIIWIIPVVEIVVILAWLFNTYTKIKISEKVRYVIFNGIFLWGVPVGFSMFINNYCTDYDISLRKSFDSVYAYIITSVLYGIIMYSIVVNKKQKN